ncbi:hypothetical protein OK348_12935 [Flavobacterium sp. MXW15]|uniref:Uncharacterized protein n=1 Tax=Xanthomonas chitinilytica TaxID=2989819 RepID=A0ABT3JWH0_9XANT|nr:hypothetical protein [Xanthomonas sp. H13-6]MCW4455691.1 hypothetical protein [Flavobacterium sp. MXW15]MCW4472823.1 hypothetical protein [Xanthomonas sp. H13-6]
MERAVELAGFFAAHGIWCVSDGEPLVPMLAQESAANGRNMLRFATAQLEDGVAQAQTHLESNPDQSDRAALVYDGYIALPTGRTDALFVIVRSYSSPAATLTMAVPYRNVESPNGFAVHRPKFVEWQGDGIPDYQALGEAFFRGVDSHGEASAVWAEHNDDSV